MVFAEMLELKRGSELSAIYQLSRFDFNNDHQPGESTFLLITHCIHSPDMAGTWQEDGREMKADSYEFPVSNPIPSPVFPWGFLRGLVGVCLGFAWGLVGVWLGFAWGFPGL